MSNLRQAAQQALEALVEINKLSIGERAICLPGEIDTAMDALRAALAEPDSDYERGFVDGMNLQTKGSVDNAINRMAKPITAAEMSTWVKDTWEKCQAEAWQKPSGSFVLWQNTLCNPLADSISMTHSAWHDGYASGVKAEQERQGSYELQQQAWTIDNKYASLLALTLECMILDPERWHDDAVRVLDDYRSEWNKLNPSPSPFGKD